MILSDNFVPITKSGHMHFGQSRAVKPSQIEFHQELQKQLRLMIELINNDFEKMTIHNHYNQGQDKLNSKEKRL